MRERIRKRLKDYRADALQSIGVRAIGSGNLGNSRLSLTINDDTKAEFAEYMDQSIKFIRQVAPGSSAEYVDELWDGGQKLKQEIIAKTDHDLAISGNSMAVLLRNELEAALDGLIERKVEDFEIGFVKG